LWNGRETCGASSFGKSPALNLMEDTGNNWGRGSQTGSPLWKWAVGGWHHGGGNRAEKSGTGACNVGKSLGELESSQARKRNRRMIDVLLQRLRKRGGMEGVMRLP